MSRHNEQNTLLGAVGAAAVSMVLAIAVTSSIAAGFLASRLPAAAGSQYAAAAAAPTPAPAPVAARA